MSSHIVLEDPKTQPVEEGETKTRRAFLLAAGAAGLCYTAALAYPIYRYLASPEEMASNATAVTEVSLKDAQKLPAGSVLMFKFGSRPAMHIRAPSLYRWNPREKADGPSPVYPKGLEAYSQSEHPPNWLAAAAVTLCGVCAFLGLYCTQPILPMLEDLFHVFDLFFDRLQVRFALETCPHNAVPVDQEG